MLLFEYSWQPCAKSWKTGKMGSNTYKRTSASVIGCCGSSEQSLCPPLADCLCHQHGIYFCKWHILFQFPFSAVLLPVVYKGKGHALPIKFAVLSKRHSLHTYNDDRVIGCVGKFTYFFLCISPYHCIF